MSRNAQRNSSVRIPYLGIGLLSAALALPALAADKAKPDTNALTAQALLKEAAALEKDNCETAYQKYQQAQGLIAAWYFRNTPCFLG